MKKEKDKHRQVGGGERIYKTESKLKKTRNRNFSQPFTTWKRDLTKTQKEKNISFFFK